MTEGNDGGLIGHNRKLTTLILVGIGLVLLALALYYRQFQQILAYL